jgi:RNA polymerase sigma-70 factor (ECF subfamily)
LKTTYLYQTDEALLALFANKKDTEAIKVLFDRYAHLVFAVSFGILEEVHAAKLATVHLFINIMDLADRIAIPNFKSWLYQIARNHCLAQKNIVLDTADFLVHEKLNNAYLQELEIYKFVQQYPEASNALFQKVQSTKDAENIAELFYTHKKSFKEIALLVGNDEFSIRTILYKYRLHLIQAAFEVITHQKLDIHAH